MPDDDDEEYIDPFPQNFASLLAYAENSGWIDRTRLIIGDPGFLGFKGLLVHATSQERWEQIKRDQIFKTEVTQSSTLGKAAYFFCGVSDLEKVSALSIAESFYSENPRWPYESPAVVVSGSFETSGVLDLRADDSMRQLFCAQVSELQRLYLQDTSIPRWKKVLPPKVFDCAIWTAFSMMFPEMRGILAVLRLKKGDLKDTPLLTFASIQEVPSKDFKMHVEIPISPKNGASPA